MKTFKQFIFGIGSEKTISQYTKIIKQSEKDNLSKFEGKIISSFEKFAKKNGIVVLSEVDVHISGATKRATGLERGIEIGEVCNFKFTAESYNKEYGIYEKVYVFPLRYPMKVMGRFKIKDKYGDVTFLLEVDGQFHRI